MWLITSRTRTWTLLDERTFSQRLKIYTFAGTMEDRRARKTKWIFCTFTCVPPLSSHHIERRNFRRTCKSSARRIQLCHGTRKYMSRPTEIPATACSCLYMTDHMDKLAELLLARESCPTPVTMTELLSGLLNHCQSITNSSCNVGEWVCGCSKKNQPRSECNW